MLDCFEAVLNGCLRKDNMDVFAAGSNAKRLSKDIAAEFAGQGDEVHRDYSKRNHFLPIFAQATPSLVFHASFKTILG